MRVGLQTIGTDGDVLPFIRLAAEFVKAGHTATLAYTSIDHKNYDVMCLSLGIGLVDAKVDFATKSDPYALTTSRMPNQQLKALDTHFVEPATDALFRVSQQLCAQSDVVIGHQLLPMLLTTAQLTAIPRVVVAFTHQSIWDPTRPPLGLDLGSWLNCISWRIGDAIMTHQLFSGSKQLRAHHGMPPIGSVIRDVFMSDCLTLISASSVMPGIKLDWPETVQVIGHLGVPGQLGGTSTCELLQKFLSHGEPPMYMTFGSCMDFQGTSGLELLTEAACLSGHRAIIQTGTVKDAVLSDDGQILFLNRVDHTTVFPQCACVVHHGGSGTTHAAIKAGRPAVVVPHAFDQSFWAQEVEKGGFGIDAGLRRKITPSLLASSIKKALTNPALTTNCERAAQVMALENGPRKAVMLVEGLLANQTDR